MVIGTSYNEHLPIVCKVSKDQNFKDSKLWRQAKKEETSKEIERKGVRKFGKQETIEFSGQGVMQCHSVERSYENRKKAL